jgi:hypothetical protein
VVTKRFCDNCGNETPEGYVYLSNGEYGYKFPLKKHTLVIYLEQRNNREDYCTKCIITSLIDVTGYPMLAVIAKQNS